MQDEDPSVLMPELAHVGKLFDSYDKDGNGELDRSEVSKLIADTYKLLGKTHFPSEAEVDAYLSGKDRMSKKTYEEMVLGSMAKRNLLKSSDF